MEISGEVDNVIFYNEENGYSVFSIINSADGDELVCTGNVSRVSPGETVKLNGSYNNHPAYGMQFTVTKIEKAPPLTITGMKKYLGSGAIKGIGETMAERIIQEFGEQSFLVIERYPEKLAQIKGISMKKALEISEIFHTNVTERAVIVFLQSYGFSLVTSGKIYKRYKDKAIDIVKNNPYKLAEDISGLSFKTVDALALRMGFEDSEGRIKSGISYALSLGVSEGHTYLPKEILIETAKTLLGTEQAVIENGLLELQIEKSVIQEHMAEHTAVFLNNYFYAQNYVAKKLIDLSANIVDKPPDIDEEIATLENELGITLADKQKLAVSEAAAGGVLVLTGGPGTGKTTTLNAIITLLMKQGHEIELCAPTGRAAKRMAEATNRPAMTIHRLLEVKFLAEDSRRQTFEKNETNTIEADVIIVDESSMVDLLLMYHLLKAVDPVTRLILVGDADQLPSVGAGNVLKDIIKSGAIKTIRLDQVFRQAQKSHIIINAHRINGGKYPIVNAENSDFFLIKRTSQPEAVQTILNLATIRLPNYKGYTLKDIQVLSPMKKGLTGVINLNTALQQAINPPSAKKNECEYRNTIFRQGDKVLQTKNNYNIKWSRQSHGRIIEEDLGVFNGDEGIIKAIDSQAQTLTVCFDDKYVTYDFSQLDELDLAYAVTVHKSQGSEYKAVIMPVLSGPPLLLSRNLFYTAITRAKEIIVLVGIDETIRKMVDNDKEVGRYSSLDEKIKKFCRILG